MSLMPEREIRDGPLAPPRPENADGETRSVGVEIEFAGLPTARAAELTVEVLGGTPDKQDDHAIILRDTQLGDIEIMLDARIAHIGSKKNAAGRLKRKFGETVGTLIKPVTPLEIVTAPVPWDELGRLDHLAERLGEAGARDTHQSVLFAFGLHLNPEVASSDVAHITAIMKAFALLQPVIRRHSEIDQTRQRMGWIGAWPADYVELLLAADYWPDRARLAADYVENVGGRDFDLDMLPLFAEFEPAALQDFKLSDLVKARPTFHYRLPDSNFSGSGGLVTGNWNAWVAVERLAEDDALLEKLCIERRSAARDNWAARIEEILDKTRLPQ
ncbi:amidoligase family protein [Pseudohoeflea coraliihabitans]|uniref:Amidoligase family protein n=1 Tax=Pseudohoeflea coraliihabitans TaxID=2860393 RepID=A0ABS6WM65_9HYPH|nr:amidoligase family protein [Pseudohoeflea sp. DP4N28-3]MBW3097057.1 amidoligase family protein [Pseudohoeflea sp. DP4N28-3]